MHVDGVETLEPTVDSGREVMLSCEIIGDISPEDYNVTWSFKKDERQNEEILGDSDSEIVIPSLTKAHEGTYICSVSGLINKVVEKTLKSKIFNIRNCNSATYFIIIPFCYFSYCG